LSANAGGIWSVASVKRIRTPALHRSTLVHYLDFHHD
jgi:hypothetical protein